MNFKIIKKTLYEGVNEFDRNNNINYDYFDITEIPEEIKDTITQIVWKSNMDVKIKGFKNLEKIRFKFEEDTTDYRQTIKLKDLPKIEIIDFSEYHGLITNNFKLSALTQYDYTLSDIQIKNLPNLKKIIFDVDKFNEKYETDIDIYNTPKLEELIFKTKNQEEYYNTTDGIINVKIELSSKLNYINLSEAYPRIQLNYINNLIIDYK